MTARDQKSARGWVWVAVALALLVTLAALFYRNRGVANVTPTLNRPSTMAAPVTHGAGTPGRSQS